jgi:non-specific serine/threonine protein kinase
MKVPIPLASQGKNDEVFDLIETMSEQAPHDHYTRWCVFLGHALRGEKSEAIAALSRDVKEFLWNDPEVQWFGVAGYALVEDKEEALIWLEHAIDRGWINYPLFAEIDPLLENIRGETRFKILMDRIKPQWESFEAGIDVSRLQPLGDGR